MENLSAPRRLKTWREPSGIGAVGSKAGRYWFGGAEGVGGGAVDAGEAVDEDVAGVGEELGGAVLPDGEAEEFGRLVDEPGGAAAGEEFGVADDVQEERDVGLHATDAVFLEGAFHAEGGVLEAAGVGGDLDQEGVVEGGDDGAGGGGAAVEPQAGAAGGAVVGDPAVVGREVVRGVFGGDAALDGEAGGVDGIPGR